MVARGSGSIVNLASVSGVRPSPSTVAYGAAKAGLLNATQTLAVELAPKVRVNAVVVGYVVTEQSHLFYGDDEGIRAVGATVPLGRMAVPDDIADVCLFLASPLARYVTGAQVLVHGGGERPSYIEAAKGPS
jgi:NAD(P)-dependent dehydrogenase (short-subunit alcohol dehydrogenase family)